MLCWCGLGWRRTASSLGVLPRLENAVRVFSDLVGSLCSEVFFAAGFVEALGGALHSRFETLCVFSIATGVRFAAEYFPEVPLARKSGERRLSVLDLVVSVAAIASPGLLEIDATRAIKSGKCLIFREIF